MSYQLFESLHQGPELLLLPNAWDAVSARLIESLGAKAIATTSAGLAWSMGYADGNALPQEELIAASRNIARVIEVPLTIDIEAGYCDDAPAVARLVGQALDVGIVGINIEDGVGTPDMLCRKIEAIRDCASRKGAGLFINTRTDVILRGIASGEVANEEITRRAARYRAAGADGLFVPGLSQESAMATISGAIQPMPLNVMAIPNLPSIERLQKSGVRRLSAGSALAQAAIGQTSLLASSFLRGTMGELFKVSMNYGAVNALFAAGSRQTN
jgi:2-methylisocitrate lyase-like PEP mutase family enzyme